MNFADLKILLTQLKRTNACPRCTYAYNDESMEIVGLVDGCHVLLNATCPNCKWESCLRITANDKAFHRKQKSIKPADLKPQGEPANEHISKDELLDFHNFLKNFDGNFVEKINPNKP